MFSPEAAMQAEPETVTSTGSKEDYLQKKKDAAEKRKSEKQMAAWRKEMEELERLLEL